MTAGRGAAQHRARLGRQWLDPDRFWRQKPGQTRRTGPSDGTAEDRVRRRAIHSSGHAVGSRLGAGRLFGLRVGSVSMCFAAAFFLTLVGLSVWENRVLVREDVRRLFGLPSS